MKHKTWGDLLGPTGSRQDLRYKVKAQRRSNKHRHHRHRHRDHDSDKIIHTAFVCGACFASGLITAQRGPSILELGYLTDSDLQHTSSLFALGAGGHLCGCIITGVAFGQFQTPLFLFWSLVLLCATTAALPWCNNYGIMAAVYFLSLSCVGCVETGSYADVARRWGSKGGRVLQLLQLCFVAGSVVSPILTHFFLTPIAAINRALGSTNGDSEDYNSTSRYYWNVTDTHHQSLSSEGGTGALQSAVNGRYPESESLYPNDWSISTNPLNLSDPNSVGLYSNLSDSAAQMKTRTHYAYGIAAAAALLAAVPFAIAVLVNKRKRSQAKSASSTVEVAEGTKAGASATSKRKSKNDKEGSNEREDRRRGKSGSSALALLLLFVLFFAMSAVEESFYQFLFTFMTQEARWSARMSALLTSWFWAGVILVRLASYYLPNRVPHTVTLALSFVALPIALAGLHVSVSGFPGSGSSASSSSSFLLANESIDGVWASVFFVGMSSSLIFPVTFTWIHSSVVVDKTGSGVMSAVVMIAFSLSGICNPLILGPLFQQGTARSGFPTLLIVEALVAGVVFVLLYVLTRRMRAVKLRAIERRSVLEKFIEKTSKPDTTTDEEEGAAEEINSETDIEEANVDS